MCEMAKQADITIEVAMVGVVINIGVAMFQSPLYVPVPQGKELRSGRTIPTDVEDSSTPPSHVTIHDGDSGQDWEELR